MSPLSCSLFGAKKKADPAELLAETGVGLSLSLGLGFQEEGRPCHPPPVTGSSLEPSALNPQP